MRDHGIALLLKGLVMTILLKVSRQSRRKDLRAPPASPRHCFLPWTWGARSKSSRSKGGLLARKKPKTRSITLPGGTSVKQPKSRGRPINDDPADDARLTVLSARIRHIGLQDHKNAQSIARCPEYGCNVGRAIMQTKCSDEDKADLWQAVKHVRQVWQNYGRALDAPSRFPKCMSILAPSEAMTADASSPHRDTRTEEERCDQAKAAYRSVNSWLSPCGPAAQSTAIRFIVEEPDVPLNDWPTVKRALLCVVDGLKGKLMSKSLRCKEIGAINTKIAGVP